MKVTVVVALDVTLLDPEGNDLPDPAENTLQRESVRLAVLEAARNALDDAEGDGFQTTTNLELSIRVDDVRLGTNP